jgi:hypothetical protein
MRRAARWLLDQQVASGGWPDAAANELPLVDADIMLGLVLARLESDPDVFAPKSLAGTPAPSSSRAAPLP